MAANPVRGEVKVKVGDVEIVMVATMENLARFSEVIRCGSLSELYQRLTGTELATALAAIRQFTVSGTGADGKMLKGDAAAKAAVAALALDDLLPLQGAFIALLAALTRKPAGGESDEGKAGASTQ